MNRREFVALAAAAPFALRPGLAASAAAPHALVTCDAEARLAVVDLESLRVVGSIRTLPDPRAIELVGDRAVVCHTAAGAVSIVDRTGVRAVVHGFEEPRYTAAHPDGVHAFVTDSGRRGLTAIDVVRGAAVGRVSLPDWPRHVTIDGRGRTLWVGLGSASPHVAVVDVADARRPRHVATVTPPFGGHDVGFLPDARRVWVTSGDRAETAIFDRGGRLRVRLRAQAPPQHVTFGARVAYVTSGAAGTLHVQSLDDGRVLRSAPVTLGSYNVQHGFGRVLTSSLDHGVLTVLDGGARVLARIHVADSCHDACFLP